MFAYFWRKREAEKSNGEGGQGLTREKMQAMLDRKLTILDVFSVMKEMNPQKSMDDYVMTAMTDEQKKSWENRKLESKAQQLERTANWQLDRMSKSLNLDEAQKDQVAMFFLLGI